MRYRLKGVLVIATWLLAASAMAQPAPVDFTLANGLRVIVQEDHRAPVVVTQVWYQVGSADEPPGLTGVSHVLEHMMFKGTGKVPAGEFSRLVAHFGGDDNAFTTDGYTYYQQMHVADRLGLALELEADRMANLRFDAGEFASELKVVMEERRLRTDDNPRGLAYERFKAMAYPSSPGRAPVIGWMRDLEGLTVDQVRDWYQRWYAPNNAILVVVGDVLPEQVRTLADKYFAAIPARPLPRRAAMSELAEPGERSLVMHLPTQVPMLYLGFNLPSAGSPRGGDDAYALSLLAGILDRGVSARLEGRVVRAGKAAALQSGYNLLARGDTLLTLSAIPVDNQSLADLRDAVLAEVWRLRDELVGQDEIQRVLAVMSAEDVFDHDQIDDQAQLLGMLASNGMPLGLPATALQRMARITPEQLREVARRYLRPVRLSTLMLEPAEDRR